MAKDKPITLGMIIDRHEKNPQDRALQNKIERGRISGKKLLSSLRKALKNNPNKS